MYIINNFIILPPLTNPSTYKPPAPIHPLLYTILSMYIPSYKKAYKIPFHLNYTSQCSFLLLIEVKKNERKFDERREVKNYIIWNATKDIESEPAVAGSETAWSLCYVLYICFVLFHCVLPPKSCFHFDTD